jgi:UDP-N-acetyl-D-glucosamine dehydrogenase
VKPPRPTGIHVTVVGQGYVGLPLARAAVHAGHTVTGYDVDAVRIDLLQRVVSPIEDVSTADLAGMYATGRYVVTDNAVTALDGFDVAVVTVPTPLRDGLPDLSAVLTAATDISCHIRPGALVVLESTVAPGTTTGLFKQALQRHTNLRAGTGFHLAFSPERIDPGNPTWGFANTPKLVAGADAAATEKAIHFYRTVCDTVIPVATADVAEFAKLLENTYRHVNIALVNELGRHAHALGIDIWQVISAAKSKPYGFQAFYPGPGVGGHCLPVDPVYLSHRVEADLHRPVDFVNLAMRVNDEQPVYVVDRVAELLNADRKALNGSKILVLGLAYKAGTGDIRETPATRIVELLCKGGAQVSVCDPYVADASRVLPAEAKVEEVSDVESAARHADVTLLVTDHGDFPYDRIARTAVRVLDTRNRFDESPAVCKL